MSHVVEQVPIKLNGYEFIIVCHLEKYFYVVLFIFFEIRRHGIFLPEKVPAQIGPGDF